MDADSLIFVSIASYRDAQLVPTIADCLAKATHPELLRFGICWQHGPDEAALPFAADPRFQIFDTDWRDSRGACWARAAIMRLYRREPWYLQVDSHCRFAPGWDVTLIDTACRTGSPKPILSAYPPPFTPSDHEVLGGEPLLMAFQDFTPDGIPILKPLPIPGWQHRRAVPVRARFLAAGFLFAPGSFVAEVPYDPALYFLGEEITMTLRAFTHGYDLFHPCASIVWHDYVRAYAVRHWDDHTAEATPSQTWNDLDLRSKARIHRLLSGEPLDTHGLGTARTLADYEAYAGLSFRHRKGQNATLLAQEPPNPPAPAEWPDTIYPWMVRIVVDRDRLPPGALDNPAFWYAAIQDADGHELYRHDFPRADLQTLGSELQITLIAEFHSGIVPATWSVTPVSRSQGWLPRIQGTLADADYTILREDDET